MPRWNIVWLTIGVILALFLPGCGKKKEPSPVAVTGQVRYASKKPVAEMVLTFHPLDDTNQSKLPAFLLDKEGRFKDTILPGRYKVTLLPIPTSSGNGPAGGANADVKGPGAVAGTNPLTRYRDRDRSPWGEIIIPETGKEDLLLTVE